MFLVGFVFVCLFPCLFVCLFVCLFGRKITQRPYGQILLKFTGNVGNGMIRIAVWIQEVFKRLFSIFSTYVYIIP